MADELVDPLRAALSERGGPAAWTRREIASLGTVALGNLPRAAAAPGPSGPNFLIFVVDQMGSASLGCNGNREVRTPNIDSIAAEGVSFSRCYVNNVVCMPSRATMLTGLTARGHGVLTNGNSLSEKVPTITAKLAERGYRTYLAGKAHYQPFALKSAGAHSFEDKGLWDSGKVRDLPYPYYGFQSGDFVGGHGDTCFGAYRRWLDREHPGVYEQLSPRKAYYRRLPGYRMPIPSELHYNHWIADRVIDRLRGFGESDRFFIWCSFPDPHIPFAACRPYSEMYDPASLLLPANWRAREDSCEFLRRYRTVKPYDQPLEEGALREVIAQTYGMMTHIDDNVGRVLAALRERGLDRNTVVVFLADHGEYLGSHHLLRKGFWPWESLVRVPFLWRAPAGVARRGGADPVVSMLDFAPTILDYAGIGKSEFDTRGAGASPRPVLPGRSLRAAIDGGAPLPGKPAVIEYDEDWLDAPLCRMRGLVDGDCKLIQYGGWPGGLLFDLKNDPGELQNLWNDRGYSGIKSRLLERLVDELAISDRFDTPRIAGA
jgi:arylsulfatase A-like enzyme